jgi:microcystin-dependent protein
MSEPFIGQITIFAGNFAPRGWAFCHGQLLPIAQNTALFSLLGTIYGGDGRTTFALPDLRGRAPIHFGQGPGLSNYNLGELGGVESVTLLAAQMPVHTHTLVGANVPANNTAPGGQLMAETREDAYAGAAQPVAMDPSAVGAAGGSQPHENRPPYLAINYIIALVGIYPSRG